MAEGVEKVPKLEFFETMKQNAWFHRSNIAASAVRTNDSCKNSDSSDFFNTLGYEPTSGRPTSPSALPLKADILVAVTDFRF